MFTCNSNCNAQAYKKIFISKTLESHTTPFSIYKTNNFKNNSNIEILNSSSKISSPHQ